MKPWSYPAVACCLFAILAATVNSWLLHEFATLPRISAASFAVAAENQNTWSTFVIVFTLVFIFMFFLYCCHAPRDRR